MASNSRSKFFNNTCPLKAFIMFIQSLLGQLYCTITWGDLLETDHYVSYHNSLDKQASLPRAQPGFC